VVAYLLQPSAPTMARSGLLAFGVVAVLASGAPARANDGTLTFAGGLSIPRCMGPTSPCEGSLDPGPSLELTAFVQQTRELGLGIIASAQRVHWSATYVGQIQGAPPSTVFTPQTMVQKSTLYTRLTLRPGFGAKSLIRLVAS